LNPPEISQADEEVWLLAKTFFGRDELLAGFVQKHFEFESRYDGYLFFEKIFLAQNVIAELIEKERTKAK